MTTTPRDTRKLATTLALMIATASTSLPASADQPAAICEQEPTWAAAMADADVVAVGERIDFQENVVQVRGANGRWTWTWKATYRIGAVIHGTLLDRQITVQSSCSGLPNTSRNHCQTAPPGKGVALFIAEDQGKLALTHRLPAEPCPEPALVQAIEREHPKLFGELRSAMDAAQTGADGETQPAGSTPTEQTTAPAQEPVSLPSPPPPTTDTRDASSCACASIGGRAPLGLGSMLLLGAALGAACRRRSTGTMAPLDDE